jgi:hypothetical protein
VSKKAVYLFIILVVNNTAPSFGYGDGDLPFTFHLTPFIKNHAQGSAEEIGEYKCISGIQSNTAPQQLPPYAMKAGADKYIIPILNPEYFIEPGDILVFFQSSKKVAGALELVLDGLTHSAIYYRNDKGKLKLLESPRGYSQTHPRSFHILRLRQYPATLEADPTFLGKARNQAESETMKEWTIHRLSSLQRLNDIINKIDKNGFSFDESLTTEASDPISYEAMSKSIFEEKKCTLRFYCSELVYTSYKLAGINVFQPHDPAEIISRIDQIAVPFFKQRYPELNNSQIYEKIFDDILSNRKHLGISKKTSSQLKEKFVRLLQVSAEQRNSLLRSGEYNLNLLRFVSPADLFNTIYNPANNIQYVGTYVDRSCWKTFWQ